MKKTLLSLTVSSLFAGSIFASSSSVAIVDLTQVFQQVPQGTTAFNTLKQQLAPQVTQLQTQQQSLQAQMDALNKNTKLDKGVLSKQKADLSAQEQALQTKVQTFQQQASQQEQALLTKFGNDVKTAVAQIAKQQDYDIVLSSQSSLYTTDGSDITKQVITSLQQQAPAGAPPLSYSS